MSNCDGTRHEVHYRIVGSSVIGPLHVQMNLACQDACAFEAFPIGSAVIAVADGLGSAARSEIGARVAVGAAVRKAKEMLTAPMRDDLSMGAVTQAAVHSAREALEQQAIEEQCKLSDLACTIIVVALCQGVLSVAHIGDGAVVAKTRAGLRMISAPGESEYANEVMPLTSNGWEESLRIVCSVTGVECLAVFTDGCQRAALRKLQDGFQPFDRFFEPIFSYARDLEDANKGEAELRALLSSKKVCDNSEDDKTLVIAVVSHDQ